MRLGIEDIRVGDLHVDPDVQRGFQQQKADRIARSWNQDVVGVLVVSRRADGTNWIMEGQHRWAAAASLFGEEHPLPCEVHVDLTLAQEADMFVQINTLRSLPSPYDRFRVSLRAGYPTETAIMQVVESLGLDVGPSAKPEKIGAVTALKRIYEDIGRPGLLNTLSLATTAFGRRPETYDADLLQAIAFLIAVAPKLDRKRLLRILGGTKRAPMNPDDWKRQAQSVRKVGGSTSRGMAVAKVISDAYDSGQPPELWIDFARRAYRQSNG
jgi:hypothetical protein